MKDKVLVHIVARVIAEFENSNLPQIAGASLVQGAIPLMYGKCLGPLLPGAETWQFSHFRSILTGFVKSVKSGFAHQCSQLLF